MESVEELIQALERAVELWEKIQEKKAVLEAEEIIRGVHIEEG